MSNEKSYVDENLEWHVEYSTQKRKMEEKHVKELNWPHNLSSLKMYYS